MGSLGPFALFVTRGLPVIVGGGALLLLANAHVNPVSEEKVMELERLRSRELNSRMSSTVIASDQELSAPTPRKAGVGSRTSSTGSAGAMAAATLRKQHDPESV